MTGRLAPGDLFPEVRLPDHTGTELSVLEIAAGQPLVLCFMRGWWCPKEQVRARGLVELQEEIQREYGGIAVVTVDPPYVNGAFRAGLGASFAFLSDEDRRVGEELGLLELTDERHRPLLPMTFALDSRRRIEALWCGFWYWGNPTPDELRLALRAITRREQPTFDPGGVWARTGAAAPDAGIEAAVVLVHEDSQGREIYRSAHEGPAPRVGDEVARSAVDGRPWIVRSIEPGDGVLAVHLRKGGRPPATTLPQHHVSAPARIR